MELDAYFSGLLVHALVDNSISALSELLHELVLVVRRRNGPIFIFDWAHVGVLAAGLAV